MAEYWDVGQWEETASGKNRFIKLGYASEKNGGGFYVNFDCLPLPKMNDRGQLRCSVVIQPAKGNYQQQGRSPAQPTGPDNEVPF